MTADLLGIVTALAQALTDLARWVVAPPIVLACLTVTVTGMSVIAARRLRRHPDPHVKRSAAALALALLLQLPARTADPSALGRLLGTAALLYLLFALARRWPAPPPRGDPRDR